MPRLGRIAPTSARSALRSARFAAAAALFEHESRSESASLGAFCAGVGALRDGGMAKRAEGTAKRRDTGGLCVGVGAARAGGRSRRAEATVIRREVSGFRDEGSARSRKAAAAPAWQWTASLRRVYVEPALHHRDHSMKFIPIQSHAEYLEHVSANRETWELACQTQQATVPSEAGEFAVRGQCIVCQDERAFLSYTPGDSTPPNWREELTCEACGFNNRTRAFFHFASKHLPPAAKIYITEQNTAFYRFLENRFPGLQGSEFFGHEILPGEQTPGQLHNEDLTSLTFGDGSFDHIISLDVLEHIPDYKLALREIRRCLRTGGTFFLTVPFAKHLPDTTVRAVLKDGRVVHLTTPEYHGDPNNPQGCLAFYTFSWPLLDDLRDAGFSEVIAHLYWSREYGYFGAYEQLLVTAKA